MSCNGCRVLRKGCSEDCMLRHSLHWIENPQAQANATVFVAKFFGRAALMSFLSSVPSTHRSALFQSLLYEAAGRTINPVNGAVGLLSTGNWHLCQLAVQKVLRSGGSTATAFAPLPLLPLPHTQNTDEAFLDCSTCSPHNDNHVTGNNSGGSRMFKRKEFVTGVEDDVDKNYEAQAKKQRAGTPNNEEESSDTTTTLGSTSHEYCDDQSKLLTLFF